ncbi:MAG TPA: DUF5690 family protein [Pirellulales bacterium]|nr:DUF5690 family protein [Pirellulales bacterium]
MNRPESPHCVSATSGGFGELRGMLWAVTAAFGTYFCMYGFRKPFTAAEFAGAAAWGIDFKTLLVVSQVLGYASSKFIGIKIISEMPPQRRVALILALVGMAEATLVLFGLVPRPWNSFCLFFNGLPLGMVYGLVVGFLEGRRLTEALTAGLCASFILADGVTKSVGTWLLAQGVPEDWMPCLAGLIFAGPLLVVVAMLARIPPPSAADTASRSARPTLTREERWTFFGRYAVGLSLLCVVYLFVTILRSLRADFAPELWGGLGIATAPATFTRSELCVACGVLAINGCAVFVRDNRTAFFVALGNCLAGFLLLTLALVGRHMGQVAPFEFMVAVGLGLYLPYVAMHTAVFERILAMTRDRGNLGFLMYVADSVGYLGYAAVMFVRNFMRPDIDMLTFFTTGCWIAVVLSVGSLLLTWWYFAQRCPRVRPATGDV